MRIYEKLDGSLVLRNVNSRADAEHYAAFTKRINSEAEGLTCACLIGHHPGVAYEDFFLVEDESTGKIVSTTCLIPWKCNFEGIELNAAMLEMVLSHPDYRKHGLVRTQVGWFMKAMETRGFDLGVIWGIPYYYRQYGYSYAVDGNDFESLAINKIPLVFREKARAYEFRRASTADIGELGNLYSLSCSRLGFYTKRDTDYWEYLLNFAKYPTYLVVKKEVAGIEGYLMMKRSDNQKELKVFESSFRNTDCASGVLGLLGEMGVQLILSGWPEKNMLCRLMRSLGSDTEKDGQWLWKITDVAVFMSKIAPALENRLRGGNYNGFTGEILINFFKRAYKLRFNEGKILETENIGFVDSSMGADGGDLCIPPEAFVRLALGYRSLDELYDAWPDITMKQEKRKLIMDLFPKVPSYIHMPFHYQGD